jgi:hypothetical protein
MAPSRRAALYVRVSTSDRGQTEENQLRIAIASSVFSGAPVMSTSGSLSDREDKSGGASPRTFGFAVIVLESRLLFRFNVAGLGK